jgi:hypothetical protein
MGRLPYFAGSLRPEFFGVRAALARFLMSAKLRGVDLALSPPREA